MIKNTRIISIKSQKALNRVLSNHFSVSQLPIPGAVVRLNQHEVIFSSALFADKSPLIDMCVRAILSALEIAPDVWLELGQFVDGGEYQQISPPVVYKICREVMPKSE